MDKKILEPAFRNLFPWEIECRIQSANKAGVQCLLYKDARSDVRILNETVGPANWSNNFSEIKGNLFCSIAINCKTEDGGYQWVSKSNCGTESNIEKQKGEASDAIKRAGFAWDIGSELYSSPNIFIPAQYLATHQQKDGRYVCYDSMRVVSVEYIGKTIKSCTIEVSNYGKVSATLVFANNISPDMERILLKGSDCTATPSVDNTNVSAPSAPADTSSMPANDNNCGIETDTITDDTVILVGNCHGKTYGEVKNSSEFVSFLTWIGNQNDAYKAKYKDPKMKAQFDAFKLMAIAM